MGIQGFTPSSGGLPGLSYIGQIYLSTKYRTWGQAGSAGIYTVKSAKGEAGYVYFIGSSTVGGPLNGVIDVPVNFTSIKVIGSSGDLATLYKVSTKSSSAFTTNQTITTYTSTVTGTSLASNKTGFIDALLVGGGGGKYQHGGGGGAGGLLLLNSFPLTPGSSFDVQIGAAGGQNQNGGDTVFAGTVAKGGGGSTGDSPKMTGQNGGSGGGGCGGLAGGISTQGSGTSAVSNPILFFSSYGTSATAKGYGNNGATYGGDHQGGGGGGAGGAASSRDGGPGLQLDFTGTNVYYAAGGYGGTYPSSGHGVAGTGWSSSGYGMGGCSNQNNTNGPSPTPGVVIVRSYDFS